MRWKWGCEIDSALQTISTMPQIIPEDYDAIIGEVIQVLEDVKALPFATDTLQQRLGDYLRIMAALSQE